MSNKVFAVIILLKGTDISLLKEAVYRIMSDVVFYFIVVGEFLYTGSYFASYCYANKNIPV